MKFYGIGMTWEWVTDGRMFISEWTIPLKTGIQNEKSSVPSIYNIADHLKWLMRKYAKIHPVEKDRGREGKKNRELQRGVTTHIQQCKKKKQISKKDEKNSKDDFIG